MFFVLFIYTSMYIHIHTRIYAPSHAHKRICISDTHIRTSALQNLLANTYRCPHFLSIDITFLSRGCKHIHMYTHIYIYIYIYINIHIHIYKCIYFICTL